jgi:hypothetical protein
VNIRINEDYRLTSDPHNVIVSKRHMTDPTKAPNWAKKVAEGTADPTPKETWREVAYCQNVENALKWIADRLMRDSNATNLAELLDEIKRFNRVIDELTAR